MRGRDFDDWAFRVDLAKEGTSLVVVWPYQSGGEVDAGSGATLGGTRTYVSGVLRCFVQQEPARSVVRQRAEIQVGDLIVDCAPEAEVTAYTNQPVSGVVSVDAMDEPEFWLHGRAYVQKDAGAELAGMWDLTEGGQKMSRVLLLSLKQLPVS